MSKSFEIRINERAKQVLNSTERMVKKVTLLIHGGLTSDTPIDTGWAASNWLLNIGGPVTKPHGSREKVDYSKSQKGANEILSYKLSSGPIFLSNNVPYMESLNDGSSTQAPKGFIEATIQRSLKEISEERLLK